MKRMLMYGCLALSLLVSACSSQARKQEVTLPTQTGLNPKAQALLTSTWPKIKTEFPGLQRYGDAIKAERVEDGLNNPDGYKKLSIELIIPNGKSSVPAEYLANGHHCYIDISPDGKTATISKRACKAALLDQNIKGTQHDNGDPLVVYLK